MTAHAPTLLAPGPHHHTTRLIWIALAVVVAAAIAVTVVVLMSTSSKSPAQTGRGAGGGTTRGHITRFDCAPTRSVHAC